MSCDPEDEHAYKESVLKLLKSKGLANPKTKEDREKLYGLLRKETNDNDSNDR